MTRESKAKSILSAASGFLWEAGFTHSLSPARNCTYGCQYCYVPTMGLYGGLKPEDWRHWGQFTTIKANAAELAGRELRAGQVIYCSPVVDPYQPAEREAVVMPALLEAVADHPPEVFVLQTRGPLILRDLKSLRRLAQRTVLRVSFSVTTNREEVRRRYEPHCEPNAARLEAIRELRQSGIEVYATLAPLLPCDAGELAGLALEASARDLVGDPLHVRSSKAHGATTRESAWKIAQRYGEERWFDPAFQATVADEIRERARRLGFNFATGTAGFGMLAKRAVREPQPQTKQSADSPERGNPQR